MGELEDRNAKLQVDADFYCWLKSGARFAQQDQEPDSIAVGARGKEAAGEPGAPGSMPGARAAAPQQRATANVRCEDVDSKELLSTSEQLHFDATTLGERGVSTATAAGSPRGLDRQRQEACLGQPRAAPGTPGADRGAPNDALAKDRNPSPALQVLRFPSTPDGAIANLEEGSPPLSSRQSPHTQSTCRKRKMPLSPYDPGCTSSSEDDGAFEAHDTDKDVGAAARYISIERDWRLALDNADAAAFTFRATRQEVATAGRREGCAAQLPAACSGDANDCSSEESAAIWAAGHTGSTSQLHPAAGVRAASCMGPSFTASGPAPVCEATRVAGATPAEEREQEEEEKPGIYQEGHAPGVTDPVQGSGVMARMQPRMEVLATAEPASETVAGGPTRRRVPCAEALARTGAAEAGPLTRRRGGGAPRQFGDACVGTAHGAGVSTPEDASPRCKCSSCRASPELAACGGDDGNAIAAETTRHDLQEVRSASSVIQRAASSQRHMFSIIIVVAVVSINVLRLAVALAYCFGPEQDVSPR